MYDKIATRIITAPIRCNMCVLMMYNCSCWAALKVVIDNLDAGDRWPNSLIFNKFFIRCTAPFDNQKGWHNSDGSYLAMCNGWPKKHLHKNPRNYCHRVQQLPSTRVRTPVALLRSLSGKYPWERYEPPYSPSSYG